MLLSSLVPGLGSAVGDGALRKLDSALDAAERGDDDGRSKNHRVPTRKPVGARKTLKRKKRLNRRAAALLLIVSSVRWCTSSVDALKTRRSNSLVVKQSSLRRVRDFVSAPPRGAHRANA